MLFFTCLLLFQHTETLTVGEVTSTIENSKTHFLKGPRDLAMSKGSVFVLDHHESTLWKINLNNHSVVVFGGPGEGPGELVKPESLYVYEDNLNVVHNFQTRIEQISDTGVYISRNQASMGSRHVILAGGYNIYSTMDLPGVVFWETPQTANEIVINAGAEEDQVRSFYADYLDDTIFICSNASINNKVYFCAIDTNNKAIADLGAFSTVEKTRPEDYPKSLPKGSTFFAATLTSLTANQTLGFLMVERALKNDPEYCYVWRYSPYNGLSKFRFLYEGLGNRPQSILHLGSSHWVAGIDGAVVFFEMSSPKEH